MLRCRLFLHASQTFPECFRMFNMQDLRSRVNRRGLSMFSKSSGEDFDNSKSPHLRTLEILRVLLGERVLRKKHAETFQEGLEYMQKQMAHRQEILSVSYVYNAVLGRSPTSGCNCFAQGCA